MSDEVSETFVLTLAGRQITFRRAKLGQVLILQRTAQRMIKQAEGDENDSGKAMTQAIIKTLDFVEALIVSEDDRQFVEDQMLAGVIDYTDVLVALGGKGDDVPDDQEPKPAKRAPRKSPKAAKVTKPVASRGRTQR